MPFESCFFMHSGCPPSYFALTEEIYTPFLSSLPAYSQYFTSPANDIIFVTETIILSHVFSFKRTT